MNISVSVRKRKIRIVVFLNLKLFESFHGAFMYFLDFEMGKSSGPFV